MASGSLGRTLIVANPNAHSGGGEAAAIYAMRHFSAFSSTASSSEVRLTESGGDAFAMASEAQEYETVVALGGDGVIHEVANGLMAIAKPHRPRLGIIPVGSGNDFARTLGVSINNPERSIAQLLSGAPRRLDLGKVNSTYFVESLSFGLDAAIALDTVDRRRFRTHQSGASLYVTSGFKLIFTGLRGWKYRAVVDGQTIEGVDIAFAIQNGPTYGGGFRICPEASPVDGYLDLCMTVEKTSLPHSLMLFGLVRFGKHVRSKALTLRKAQHIEVEFPGDEKPPCQVDGESLAASRYVIDVVQSEIEVIVPHGRTL